MSDLAVGLWSFPLLLGLAFLRAPIGLAMLLVGAAGLTWLTGSPAMLLSRLKTETFPPFPAIRCRSFRCSC